MNLIYNLGGKLHHTFSQIIIIPRKKGIPLKDTGEELGEHTEIRGSSSECTRLYFGDKVICELDMERWVGC